MKGGGGPSSWGCHSWCKLHFFFFCISFLCLVPHHFYVNCWSWPSLSESLSLLLVFLTRVKMSLNSSVFLLRAGHMHLRLHGWWQCVTGWARSVYREPCAHWEPACWTLHLSASLAPSWFIFWSRQIHKTSGPQYTHQMVAFPLKFCYSWVSRPSAAVSHY